MIVGYLLYQLSKAVITEDYAEQSRIAELLLPYLEIGKVTEKDVFDICKEGT